MKLGKSKKYILKKHELKLDVLGHSDILVEQKMNIKWMTFKYDYKLEHSKTTLLGISGYNLIHPGDTGYINWK